MQIRVDQKQELLECERTADRLKLCDRYLNYELEISRLERKIGAVVRQNIEKNQKEYYLREQLRSFLCKAVVRSYILQNFLRGSEIGFFKRNVAVYGRNFFRHADKTLFLLENLFSVMYKIPSEKNVKEVVVTKECVTDKAEPRIIYKETA